MVIRTDKMHIKKSDFVLEIGSGNNPNLRSDILCDKFAYTNKERAGGFPIVIDRPFVICDGMRLPFPDKCFDYVICSHILEHMHDPIGFCKEITRVAKAGYIEVPSAVSERMFGWPFHHWYLTFNNSQIMMQHKTIGVRFGGFFHRLINHHISFRRNIEEHESQHYLKLEWKSTITLNVKLKSPSVKYLQALDNEMINLLKTYRLDKLKDIIFYLNWIKRRILRKSQKIQKKILYILNNQLINQDYLPKLLKIIRCIKCYNRLELKSGKLYCKKCKRKYPIQNSIPIILD
jgi:uncharacterized protein YbaR (Trm112 family)